MLKIVFFQNPLFSIFSLCFWNSDYKIKVIENSILLTGSSFQGPNSKLEQRLFFLQKLRCSCYHAKNCNFFQNPSFSIFSLCFWNSNHKTKVAGNSILPTGTRFQRSNSKLEQCVFFKKKRNTKFCNKILQNCLKNVRSH